MITSLRSVIAGNPHATLFLVGFGVFVASLAVWSGPLAGTVAGGILMAVAAWPFLRRKGN